MHHPDNYVRFYLSKVIKRNIATFEVHNIYKRFTVSVVTDLRKVISKQTPPLNKGRTGNAENEINAAAFNRINTVANRRFFWIFGFLSHSDRILTDCPNHFPDFDLESFSFFESKIYLLWKIWPISIKQWKPMWIRACCLQFFSHYAENNNRICLSAHSYSFWPH